jgi:predicted ATPase
VRSEVHHQANRFFVLTGGPGSGKTTLIEALHQRGYARSMEAGRGIIQDQVAIDGSALPWKNPARFAEQMLSWELRSYKLAEGSTGVVFFDRGIPDIVGYLRLVGLSVPEHVHKAAQAFRYNRRVFISPPWKEIFQPDRERKQGFDEAVRTYQSMVATYGEYGYELGEIPRVSVEARVSFILDAVANTDSS